MTGADTTFLVDFLKGEPNAVEWMKKHKDYLCLSELVIYEFLCGRLTEQQKDTFLGFISQFPVFSFDRQAAVKASEIFRDAKIKGTSVAHPDAMIAGTYEAHGIHKIVTRNKKHFEKIMTVSSY